MDIRTHKLEKANLAIPKILRHHQLLLPYKLYQAKRDWPKIAGAQIAKYSYILEFQGKTAVIAVLNPVYMSYLFMYKRKLIQALNAYAGQDVIADIRFVKRGRRPQPAVYEMADGEEKTGFSPRFLQAIRLDEETVTSIRRDCARLPEALREKMIRLRFAQEKRKKAYAKAGFRRCRCGRWMAKGETCCLFCRLEKAHQRRMQVRQILVEMPWLSLDKTLAELGLSQRDAAYERAYNDVRRNLIYQHIEKVYYQEDSPADDLVLAMLITRKGPGDIPSKFIENLVAKYRKKEGAYSKTGEFTV